MKQNAHHGANDQCEVDAEEFVGIEIPEARDERDRKDAIREES